MRRSYAAAVQLSQHCSNSAAALPQRCGCGAAAVQQLYHSSTAAMQLLHRGFTASLQQLSAPNLPPPTPAAARLLGPAQHRRGTPDRLSSQLCCTPAGARLCQLPRASWSPSEEAVASWPGYAQHGRRTLVCFRPRQAHASPRVLPGLRHDSCCKRAGLRPRQMPQAGAMPSTTGAACLLAPLSAQLPCAARAVHHRSCMHDRAPPINCAGSWHEPAQRRCRKLAGARQRAPRAPSGLHPRQLLQSVPGSAHNRCCKPARAHATPAPRMCGRPSTTPARTHTATCAA